MKLITQLIAILIVMKIVVSDLLKCFKERKKIMSLFKVSVISCLCITSAKKRLEDFKPLSLIGIFGCVGKRVPKKNIKGRTYLKLNLLRTK